METYYYIPVSSLNFSNILSSESVSPKAFYEKRGYGLKRFEKNSANPFDYFLLAYSAVPRVEASISDREAYTIYIAVPEEFLHGGNGKSRFKDITIIQVDRPVYLNYKDCHFVVNDLSAKTELESTARSSIEAKYSDLYMEKMLILDGGGHAIDSFDWTEAYLSSIRESKTINQKHLESDQKINKIKGFIYAFVCGKIKEQSKYIIEARRCIQDFINIFSFLMNNFSSASRGNHNGNNKSDKKYINNQIDELQNIKKRIENIFNEDTNNRIRERIPIPDKKLEELKTYTDKKNGTSIHEIVDRYVNQGQRGIFSVAERLDELLVSLEKYNQCNHAAVYDKLIGDFSSVKREIESTLSSHENKEIGSVSVKNIPVEVGKEFLPEKFFFDELNDKENRYWKIVINELLSRVELSTSNDIAQQREGIITGVMNTIKNEFENHKSSKELPYLRKLQTSLKKIGIGFKPNDSENLPLQSFACFLSRFAELDKLQDYMEKNEFSNYSLAYGNWGAAYGYANLSKLLLSPLVFNRDALEVVLKFTTNLQKRDLTDTGDASSVKEPAAMPHEKEKSFRDLITANKKFQKKDWIDAIVCCFVAVNKKRQHQDDLLNKIASKCVEEFESEIKKKGKKLPGFGPVRIKEAVKMYKDFTASQQ